MAVDFTTLAILAFSGIAAVFSYFSWRSQVTKSPHGLETVMREFFDDGVGFSDSQRGIHQIRPVDFQIQVEDRWTNWVRRYFTRGNDYVGETVVILQSNRSHPFDGEEYSKSGTNGFEFKPLLPYDEYTAELLDNGNIALYIDSTDPDTVREEIGGFCHTYLSDIEEGRKDE